MASCIILKFTCSEAQWFSRFKVEKINFNIIVESRDEKNVLQDMVNCAHKNNLKIAAHVTTVDAVELAVETGVDILIHVPIGEKFPEELAKNIADKNIAVIPTLVMMEAFANSAIYGFKESDYQDAKNAVRLLNSHGVPILVGTDAKSKYN